MEKLNTDLTSDWWKKIDLKELLDLVNFQINSFQSYCKLNELINHYLNNNFAPDLEGKCWPFVNAFKQSLITLYTIENAEEKQELLILLMKKNQLKVSLLLFLAQKWFFDNLFSDYEKIEFFNIIASKIMHYLDIVYLNWTKTVKDNQFSWKNYWWIKQWNLVPYTEFCEPEMLDSSVVVCGNISKYITKFIELLKSWKTDEKSWLELEKYYLWSWDDESQFWLVWMLENYYNETLIEPELEFYLKQVIWEEEKQTIFTYSMDRYHDIYWMDQTNVYKVEKIISSWASGFMQILWRNFPNDVSSKQEFWSKIYIVSSSIINWFEVYKKRFEALVWYIPDTKEQIWEHAIDHVVYHEFWHNLFKVDWFESNLEELKASLYYYLKLYSICDSLNQQELSDIIHMIIFDLTKRFPWECIQQLYKYVLAFRVIYFHMKNTWVVDYKDWKLLLNTDPKLFKLFLWEMVWVLDFIKQVYESQDKNKEQEFIKTIEDATKDDLEQINQIIKDL